ncbi:hypothetical protein [Leptolyngbya sp. PCC 6406]|uniref:hypothetical protein n=1 Tax=Leptolyngbya sp. PCC 6406 TaxID=1173264 RepID=UPI0002ABCB78|nr:hypothetical protein [Leptolyngbya sp. PCC 6406]
MVKFLTTALSLAGLATLIAANPAVAVPTTITVEQLCAQEVQTAITTIETGRSAIVTYWTTYEFNESSFTDYPPEAPVGLWLRIDGPAADSVMVSPQFLKALSAELIQTCNGLSSVTFNRDHTGWTEVFGLVNGEVRQFDCVGDDYNWVDPLPWGQMICGL